MLERFQLDLPNGIKVSPDMPVSVVDALGDIMKSDMKNGYIWYSWPKIEIYQKSMNLSLCFFRGRLDVIRLSLNDSKYGTGWDDWSEVKEKQKAEDTLKLIKKSGFNVGSFPWGSIWSGYDRKAGFGYTTIKYNSEA